MPIDSKLPSPAKLLYQHRLRTTIPAKICNSDPSAPYMSMSRLTHAPKLPNHRLINAAKHLCPCMLVNHLQHTLHPLKDLGSCYCDTCPPMEQLSIMHPAMVPHTAACGDTSVNAVSKQPTLSQVAPLPHCRLCLATAS